jgi:hypothetical protein
MAAESTARRKRSLLPLFDRQVVRTLSVVPTTFAISRANERKAVQECQRMETRENGRPGRAKPGKVREVSISKRKSRH